MNIIGRFTKNLVDSVADAGEKFLNYSKLRGSSNQILLKLCDDLISHKGVASGIALAREVVVSYNKLSNTEKLDFFKDLYQNMGPDLEEIRIVANNFTKDPSEETLADLTNQLKSKRQKLFSRMIMAPNGTKAIVSLREDLLGFINKNESLKIIDEELRVLLTSWFNPGFLTLEKIDWNTEASILEKIIQYESVHTITDWKDLKNRLTINRRCFAYFHPALDDEPLIFVEIALTVGISSSIQSIINDDNKIEQQADTAIFYSINNCQYGLRKVPLGNFLIKMVVTELAMELPSIKKFSSLSPVPGFADWLKKEIASSNSKFITDDNREIYKLLEDEFWYQDSKKSKKLKKPLIKACAHYLLMEKKYGKPINPVARFHFGNGAKLFRINWMGNTSEYGINKSFGLMVNYVYNLKKIEDNHEAYVQNGELAISKSVKSILEG